MSRTGYWGTFWGEAGEGSMCRILNSVTRRILGSIHWPRKTRLEHPLRRDAIFFLEFSVQMNERRTPGGGPRREVEVTVPSGRVRV